MEPLGQINLMVKIWLIRSLSAPTLELAIVKPGSVNASKVILAALVREVSFLWFGVLENFVHHG